MDGKGHADTREGHEKAANTGTDGACLAHRKAKPISKDEGFKRWKVLDEGGSTKARTTSMSKIQKVVFLLRDHKKIEKYFEPRAVSLGPIHHGTEKLQLAEDYKLKLAHKFVKESGRDKNELYKRVEDKIEELKECFDKKVIEEIDNQALAWMLFVDGCAILQFIYCAAHGKFKEMGIKSDSVAFGQQDLFLLENQLPYRLLGWLMSSNNKENDLRESIKVFIGNNIYTAPPRKESMWSKLFRLLKGEKLKEGENTHSQSKLPEHRIHVGESSHSQPTHLLDLLRTRLLGCKMDDHVPKTQNKQHWQSYRNVQELRAAGIRLQPSENSLLRNISFTRFLNFFPGYLKLPHIKVDDSTGPKFMNLIAYEMCPDFDNDFGVTSYISFLDSLIDQPNDVQELRKARVLHNFLGSDEEVAKLFNEIGTDLVPNPDAYSDVKQKIQDYYDNNWMTWIAQFLHNHFSSPWTIGAFVGAIAALVLSGFQVWYAVHPPSGPCDDFCMHT